MPTATLDSRTAATLPFCMTGAFVTCDIADTLLLKLCGFVEDQRARVIDVSEDHLKIRVGYSLFERLWHGIAGHGPLDVTLDINQDGDDGLADWQRVQATHSTVAVVVQPAGGVWRRDRFERCAKRVLHNLRLHLMAS